MEKKLMIISIKKILNERFNICEIKFWILPKYFNNNNYLNYNDNSFAYYYNGWYHATFLWDW